jgi:1-acyl-sn-glycerol-3-phosphate acyltransferase
MTNEEHELIQVSALRQVLLDDLFKDFTQTRKRWLRTLMEPFVWFSVHRFASLAANVENTVALYGFRQALQDFLALLTKNVELYGYENVPQDGPLLIVSNHPGAIDSVAIGASLPRDDLRIVATGFPLLQRLPLTSRHLIYIDPHDPMNITGVRDTIQHLKEGKSVLIFPSGRVEPDPAILPSARDVIQKWSPSIELFLRRVPQTQVMVTIVSGVLSPIFLRNPLIRLWSGVRDPLAIAEATQVIAQMIAKKRFRVSPRISFDIPRTIEELQRDYQSAYQAILEQAGALMSAHLPDAGQTSPHQLREKYL